MGSTLLKDLLLTSRQGLDVGDFARLIQEALK